MEWLLLQRSNGLRGTRERERERLDVVVDERRVKFETSSRRVGRQTERIVIPAVERRIDKRRTKPRRSWVRIGLIIQHRKEDRGDFGCCKREGLNPEEEEGNFGAGEGSLR